MKIINPSLVLTFTYDNTVLTTTDIEIDSISVVRQLYNELNAASNTVSLNLIPNSTIVRRSKTLIGNIISEDADIKAVLKEGNTVLYSGYLSDNYTWRINRNNEDVLQINLEDNGTRLLNKTFVSEDNTFKRDTAANIISEIATKCGIQIESYASDVSVILANTITKTLSSSETCVNILKDICYELGLIYTFNTSGKLEVLKTDLEKQSTRTLWADNTNNLQDGSLYSYSNTAVELTRNAKQYKQVKVQYDSFKDSQIPIEVYKVTESIQVPGGQWWDGETHSEDIYDLTLDDFFQEGKTYYTHDETGYHVAIVVVGAPVPTDTYYEYAGNCATVDMTDLNEGKDIVYVYPNSVTPNLSNQTTALEGYVEANLGFGNSKWTLKPHGNTNKLDVLIDNTLGTLSVYYNKFKATARIITKNATNNIYRAAVDLTSNSEIQFDYEAKWIHDKSLAVSLTELLNNYYLYCNNTYTFYTDEDLTLGSIATLKDNIHTGLDINVMLTSQTYTGNSSTNGVYKYTGQAVSPFSLATKIRSYSSGTGLPASETEIETNSITDVQSQYCMLAEGYSPTSSTVWYTDVNLIPDEWAYGYVYWEKKKYTWRNGDITYGNPGLFSSYTNSLVESMRFNISSSQPTFVRNLRVSGGARISLSADYFGYQNATLTWTTSFGTLSGNVLNVPYINGVNEVVITATIAYTYIGNNATTTKNLTLVLDDQTQYYKYFGSLSAAPQVEEVIIKGDFYFNNTNGITYVYDEGDWKQLSITDDKYHEIQMLTLEDKFSASDATQNIVLNNEAYLRNLVAKVITAEYIGAKQIELSDAGVIKSKGYVVQRDASGRLTPSSDGFAILASGESVFKNSIISDATLINTDARSIKSETLISQNTNEVGNTYYAEYSSEYADCFYSVSDLVTKIGTLIPSSDHNKVTTLPWGFTGTRTINGSDIIVNENYSKTLYCDNSAATVTSQTYYLTMNAASGHEYDDVNSSELTYTAPFRTYFQFNGINTPRFQWESDFDSTVTGYITPTFQYKINNSEWADYAIGGRILLSYNDQIKLRATVSRINNTPTLVYDGLEIAEITGYFGTMAKTISTPNQFDYLRVRTTSNQVRYLAFNNPGDGESMVFVSSSSTSPTSSWSNDPTSTNHAYILKNNHVYTTKFAYISASNKKALVHWNNSASNINPQINYTYGYSEYDTGLNLLSSDGSKSKSYTTTDQGFHQGNCFLGTASGSTHSIFDIADGFLIITSQGINKLVYEELNSGLRITNIDGVPSGQTITASAFESASVAIKRIYPVNTTLNLETGNIVYVKMGNDNFFVSTNNGASYYFSNTDLFKIEAEGLSETVWLEAIFTPLELQIGVYTKNIMPYSMTTDTYSIGSEQGKFKDLYLSGNIKSNTAEITTLNCNNVYTKAEIDALLANYVSKSGDTMTGALRVPSITTYNS